MAGFSIAPMVAAHMAVTNNPALRRGSGGGGEPPENDNFELFPKWTVYLIGFMLAALVIFLFVRIAFTKEQASYVVDGALIGYDYKYDKSGGNVYVGIMHADGKVWHYATHTKPKNCHQHVLGIGIQVRITPYHNAILNETSYESQLLFDPCGK